MNISDKGISFLKLVMRSPDIGDGWRNVSQTLWPLVASFENKELIDIDYEYSRIKLSDRGQVVCDYI